MFRLALLLAALAASLAGPAAAATNYCSVCDKHTLCLYPTNAAGPACRNFATSKLTNGDRNAIVKAHNELRNKVALGRETRGLKPQPAAANMRKIVSRSTDVVA